MNSNETKYWTADEVLAGIKEKPASERGTYPRFSVYVDGEYLERKTRKGLDNLVSIILSKAPKVFINAGKGVTIDFDNTL